MVYLLYLQIVVDVIFNVANILVYHMALIIEPSLVDVANKSPPRKGSENDVSLDVIEACL